MPATSYSYTPNAMGHLHIVEVTDLHISSTYRSTTLTMPLNDITSVQLWYDPTRFDLNRFRCRIRSKQGSEILLQSSSCAGIGQFVDQPDAYHAFVTALHRQLAAQVNHIDFISGVGGLRYAVNVGCMGIALVSLALVFFCIGVATLGPFALIQLALLAWLTPRAWRWLHRNRSKPYAPTSIPAALLPAISAPPAATSIAPVNAALASPSPSAQAPISTPSRRYCDEDFGPIAEPGDQSWSGAAGTKTHWADAARYAAEANEKLDAGLIGPPADPPPQGEQPLKREKS